MTKELRKAIEIMVAQMKSPRRVLEVGSRAAVNQEELCDLRALFPQSEYIGIDMQAGPGVDMVADATSLPFKDKTFDLILCLETLEHASEPWKIVNEIERVSTQNGIVILSSQQNFPLHMHPSDYFRYTPYGLSSLLKRKNNQIVLGISPPFDNEVALNPKHVIVIGWNGETINKQKMKRAIKSGESLISGHKPYRHRLQDGLKIIKRAISELQFRHAIKFFE